MIGCTLFALIAILYADSALAVKKGKHGSHGAAHTKAVHHNWNYGAAGPKTWASSGYRKCGGHRQSPINIDTKHLSNLKSSSISHNYMRSPGGRVYQMVNNGHALQINLPARTGYRLKKGGATFQPLQVHMHFGNANSGRGGSEHKLDGEHTFAEIHMVHKNVKHVPGAKNDLLVVGMFADIVEDADYKVKGSNWRLWSSRGYSGTSFAMTVFTTFLKHLRNPGDSISIPAFTLGWLLPLQPRGINNVDQVNYYGSLTTPPCSQIVDWILITGRKLSVSKANAKKLLSVRNSEKKVMAGNNRPVQKIYGRKPVGIATGL